MTGAIIRQRGGGGTTRGGIVRDGVPPAAVVGSARAAACSACAGRGPAQAGHAAVAVVSYGEQSSRRTYRRASDARRS